jgi:hypothetical protein
MFFDSENFQKTRTKGALISKKISKKLEPEITNKSKNLTTLVHCFDGQLWWFGFIINHLLFDCCK